jgi:hypothetical protein
MPDSSKLFFFLAMLFGLVQTDFAYAQADSTSTRPKRPRVAAPT